MIHTASPPHTATVRRAHAHEEAALAETLARAFYDDPPIQWLFPDDTRRMKIARRGFRLYLRRLWLPQNEVWTTADEAGVAAWERPGEWQVPVGKQLRMLPGVLAIYGRLTPRLLRAVSVVESNHPQQAHWYLPFIGVRPDRQGRGFGSRLMAPVLDRCDETQTPAYLEATTPRGRALYKRHGFEVTEEFRLGKGAPPQWRMWREPSK